MDLLLKKKAPEQRDIKYHKTLKKNIFVQKVSRYIATFF
jgi:hypothetical protein